MSSAMKSIVAQVCMRLRSLTVRSPFKKRLEVAAREVRHAHGSPDALAESGSREAFREASPFSNGGGRAVLHMLSRSLSVL
jgi:hypothetical protein